MLVIDGKAFPCHRKANVFLYCVELKETSSLNRNKLVSTSLQDIIYLHLWLVLGKNTQPSMAIMTVYRAVFCILPLDNSITSLSTGWPGQQRQISVWVHVNQWKLQFFCGGVAKYQLFSQAKGNFEKSWVKSAGCGQQSKTCLIKISSNNMNITGQCLQVIIRILSA